MESLAAYGMEEDEEEDQAQPLRNGVTLTVGSKEWTISSWDDVVKDNVAGFLTLENFKDRTAADDVVAFHDRLLLDDDWRFTFVVRQAECVHLFDEFGAVRDEDDTPDGFQFLDKFLEDWEAGYYQVALKQPSSSSSSSSSSSDGDTSDDKKLAEMVADGKRVKLFLGATGVPGAWYGGLVFPDPEVAEAKLVAFDDGELTSYKMDHLATLLQVNNLAAARDNEGGIIAGDTGESKAEDLSYYHSGAGKRCATVLTIHAHAHATHMQTHTHAHTHTHIHTGCRWGCSLEPQSIGSVTNPSSRSTCFGGGHSRRSSLKEVPHERGQLPPPAPLLPLPTRSKRKGAGILSEKATMSNASTVVAPANLASDLVPDLLKE